MEQQNESEIQGINDALLDVPFEELLSARSQGFTKAAKPPKRKDAVEAAKGKKATKDAPVERSAKIPVKTVDYHAYKERVSFST